MNLLAYMRCERSVREQRYFRRCNIARQCGTQGYGLQHQAGRAVRECNKMHGWCTVQCGCVRCCGRDERRSQREPLAYGRSLPGHICNPACCDPTRNSAINRVVRLRRSARVVGASDFELETFV